MVVTSKDMTVYVEKPKRINPTDDLLQLLI